MEPTYPTIKVHVGDFQVVQVKDGAITINLGKHVHATIHPIGLTHNVKAGDTLPFYTEIPHAIPGQTSIQ